MISSRYFSMSKKYPRSVLSSVLRGTHGNTFPPTLHFSCCNGISIAVQCGLGIAFHCKRCASAKKPCILHEAWFRSANSGTSFQSCFRHSSWWFVLIQVRVVYTNTTYNRSLRLCGLGLAGCWLCFLRCVMYIGEFAPRGIRNWWQPLGYPHGIGVVFN